MQAKFSVVVATTNGDARNRCTPALRDVEDRVDLVAVDVRIGGGLAVDDDSLTRNQCLPQIQISRCFSVVGIGGWNRQQLAPPLGG